MPITDQLRSGVSSLKLTLFTMKYQANITIPFGDMDRSVKNFRKLNLDIAQSIKQSLQSTYVQIADKGIYHSASSDLLEGIFEDSSATKGKAKNTQKGVKTAGEVVEVGNVNLEKLDVICGSQISDNNRYDNIFNFKGTVHLNCYLALNDKSTLKDVIDLLCKDVDTQFSNRLEIFDDESQNNSKYL